MPTGPGVSLSRGGHDEGVTDTEARTEERFAVRFTAGALVVLAALAAFAVILGLVAAGWAPLHRLDLRVDDRLNHYVAARPGEASFWRGVSTVGQPATFEVLAVLAAIVLWLRAHRRLALFVVVTVMGSSLLNNLVKFLVDRARPKVQIVLTHPAGTSFPSGHAMASFVALGLVALLARSSAGRTVAGLVGAGCGLVALLIGFSRLALGAHYLSDVVGAWLLGLAWLVALIQLFGVARAGAVSGRQRP